jgi:transposase
MFIIGIDPHRGSHAAVVIDDREQICDELALVADRQQCQRLLDWASRYHPRLWAIEGATGTGALLAQQLVVVGEHVVDVPPALAARVRLLDNEQRSKTDRHDARSVAVVGQRKHGLRPVAVEDHVAVLRLLAKRHHGLIAGRTRAVCRLHSTLCYLAEGHFPKRLRADQAAAILARIHPNSAIARERKTLARHLLVEVRRFDRDLAELEHRIRDAVTASNSRVTDVHGVGPIVAAYLLGYSGDVTRFPSAGHYARYNGHRPDRRLQRHPHPAPPQPCRQPSTQPRPPHRRSRPDQPRHPGTELLPPQTSRRTQPQRSTPSVETPDLRRRLPPPRRRRHTLTNHMGPGGQSGTTLQSSVAG